MTAWDNFQNFIDGLEDTSTNVIFEDGSIFVKHTSLTINDNKCSLIAIGDQYLLMFDGEVQVVSSKGYLLIEKAFNQVCEIASESK